MIRAQIALKHMSTSPAALPSGPKPVPQPTRREMVLSNIPSFKPKAPVAPVAPVAPDVLAIPTPAVASVFIDVRDKVELVAPTAPAAPPVATVLVDVRDEVESVLTEATSYIVAPTATKWEQEDEVEAIASQSRGRRTMRSTSRSRTRERNTEASVTSGQSKSSRQTMKSAASASISKVKDHLSNVSISKAIGNFLTSKSKSRSRSNLRSRRTTPRSTPRSSSRSRGRSVSTGRGTDVPASNKAPIKKQLLPPSYDSPNIKTSE